MQLERIADSAIALFAMTATISRASASLDSGIASAERERKLTTLYCDMASNKIATLLENHYGYAKGDDVVTLLYETCDVRLLSEVDTKLHYKGRKHKNLLRRQTSATISKVVDKAQSEQEPVAQVAVEKVDVPSLNSHPNVLEHRKSQPRRGTQFQALEACN
ncbi:hypothetical protein PsorP6_017693 [Peronosclerospora sorghi]|uniref:Uncharacterized protein n=1 Tax=Peronosclerospora sorghi TaxID=230839 RepID=A0ACC0WLY8_9STRA|nr:hypothetical protein PsorP6_017693 [Peronosclerospora sorghi]